MNIIQSYYQFNKNTPAFRRGNDNYLLNFYSLLLSYLTINKFYGKVTMFCNELAYNEMLKYIPYDNLIKNEITYINDKNYSTEWGLLKIDVFQKQKKPFIHFDTDVFFFKDILSQYIKNNKYDGIVQSIDFDNKSRVYDRFYLTNKRSLAKYGFIDPIFALNDYNKHNITLGYNCGIIGFNNLEFKEDYVHHAKLMNDFINKRIFYNAGHQTMMFEQYCLYSLAKKRNIKMFEALPEKDILELGFNETGNKHGYTHLLSGNKYVVEFILKIRERIFKDFPKHKSTIYKFEEDLNNKDIQFIIQPNINKYMNKGWD